MKGDATMNPLSHRGSWVVIRALLGALVLTASQVYGQPPNIRYTKQGFSMRAALDNRGAVGRAVYPEFGAGGGTIPDDSIGLEYPLGTPFEHIFGAGLWVGGKLDTARIGSSAPLRLVTTAYEGWAGPYFEFYPGYSPADSIWKVVGRGIQRPPSWDAYWGNSIARASFSDNDHYCTYTDTSVRVTAHVPLRLKVVQSSFVWNHPDAEAIYVLEYKVINMGDKQIDSAYIGMFNDGDVGPYSLPNYYQRNYTGYLPSNRTAYIHNPLDIGSTPVGLTLVHTPYPLDSLTYTFRWWSGSGPGTDYFKYQLLSSGVIDSNQSLANLSETRCLISFGPFTLRPPGGPVHDTVVVVFAIVSGQNLTVMRQQAERAKQIYLGGGQVSVGEGRDELPERAELFQNYPNPFNPTTTIRFLLPKSAYVKLGVFNILGQEVSSLVAAARSAGTHEARWDATDNPSGVYFYRLQAGDYLETKKLMLLR
jgi:hypothetical protein